MKKHDRRWVKKQPRFCLRKWQIEQGWIQEIARIKEMAARKKGAPDVLIAEL